MAELVTVVVDTREQESYSFPPRRFLVERRALPAGDYSLAGLEHVVAVERKTAEDFVHTVIRDRDRFRRELLKLANYDRDILAEIRGCAADTSDDLPEIVPDYHFLWVATDLDSFEEYDPRFGYELNCDPVYRMLDASYYAWLRHRMGNARKSYDASRLDDATFNTLRERFNAVHSWAVRHIGEEDLRRAVRTTNVKFYVPPSEQTFSAYRKTWDDAWNAYQRNQAARGQSAEPSDQARRLQHLLDTQGYAGIRSSIIDDIVVFVRDDSVIVPAKWTTKIQFTMDELRLMVGSTPEAVKQIHEVKRVFGGKVVPADDDPFGISRPGLSTAGNPGVQQFLFQSTVAASTR